MHAFVVAADKGIQPFYAVDQPLGQQKIQGTVHCGRLAATGQGTQPIQQRIGAHGFAGLQDEAQYVATHLRQAHTATGAFRLGPCEACCQCRASLGRAHNVIHHRASMARNQAGSQNCYVIA